MADIMGTTTADEGTMRALKDITAGSVGGIAQVLTGQPFDIVKVRVHILHILSPAYVDMIYIGTATNAVCVRTKRVRWGNRLCQENHCE